MLVTRPCKPLSIIDPQSQSQVSTKAEPRKDNNHFSRVSTRQSTHSRISTSLNSRSKKSRLPPAALPISDLNKGIVGWQSQEDPEMPLNFTERRKWTLIALLASISFISPLASSMFAPGVSFMSQEFNNDSAILQSLTVSIFVLGYAIGPLFLAPLSEIYGRRFVITGANAFFCVWQIGCALAPNLQSLIIFRFLTGVGGSGCLTIGGGVIADLFPPDRRGIASAVYSLGPLFGPVVGPVCGGFIAQRAGWRWVFWILLIAGTFVSLCIELLTRETNHRVLIHRKLRRKITFFCSELRLRYALTLPGLQQKLNRPGLKSCYDETTGPAPTPTQVLLFGITRPLKMLFCSPIIFLVSLYMAVCYGLLYLLFTTITQVFSSTYGWSPEICGLAYIALGPGYVGALAIVARISDATVVRMTKANDGIFEPEMRLPACIFFACFIPITFFWYGWSADKGVHVSLSLLPSKQTLRLTYSPSGSSPSSASCPSALESWASGFRFRPTPSTPSPSSPPPASRPSLSCVQCSARSCLWPARRCTSRWAWDGATRHWALLLLASSRRRCLSTASEAEFGRITL